MDHQTEYFSAYRTLNPLTEVKELQDLLKVFDLFIIIRFLIKILNSKPYLTKSEIPKGFSMNTKLWTLRKSWKL